MNYYDFKAWKLLEKFYIDYEKANLIKENTINELSFLTRSLLKGKK